MDTNKKQDEATGDVYYVNTWNQEIRWIKPLEISLFESRDSAMNRPGTGNSSRLSGGEDDDDDDGSGRVASIGDRFQQRLVDLTGEATTAAEEEERFIRFVTANITTIIAAGHNDGESNRSGGGSNEGGADGADKVLALAAAREWRFVSTDKRLLLPSPGTATKQKCWYHANTSEYFWGNNPPLLGLLRRAGDGALRKNSTPQPVRGSDSHDGRRQSALVGDIVSGDVGVAGPTGTVHPEFGLVFPDRASGEAWLKTQDLGPLLATSVRVCDIGPAGWCQLRAAVPSHCTVARGRGNGDSLVSAEYSPAQIAMSTVTRNSAEVAAAGKDRVDVGIRVGRSADSGRSDNNEPVHDNRITKTTTTAAEKVAEETQAAAAAEDSTPITSPDDGGSSLPLSSFTFFHHFETGEVRWCLSPRSALLATPRTSRREASYARRLSAAAAYEHIERQQPHGWGQDGSAGAESEFEQPGVVAPDGGTLVSVDGASGVSSGNGEDDWEEVEDGDMIFYYNKRLGVSTWEPPPEWEQRGNQELYGAGG